METPKQPTVVRQLRPKSWSDKATSDMQLGEGGQGPNLAIGENLHEDGNTGTCRRRERRERWEDVGQDGRENLHLGGGKDEGSFRIKGWNFGFDFCLGRRLCKYLHDGMFDKENCCFILGEMDEI